MIALRLGKKHLDTRAPLNKLISPNTRKLEKRLNNLEGVNQQIYGPQDQVKAGIQTQHGDLSRKCTVHKISILNLMPSLRDRVLAPCLFPMDTGGSSWIIKSSQE